MFLRILTSALFAGAGAGLLAALLQLLFLQPVLLEAERYESGEAVHFAAAGGHAQPGHDHGEATAGESHGQGEAAEAESHDNGDGESLLPRDAMSVVFAIAVYAGYGLMLVAAMAVAEARGAAISLRRGIVWGVAGFVTVHLAPAFSLAPEVPGVAAADITARQIWWFGTVAATAVALWLIAFGGTALAWAGAAALILAPHLIGAPEAADYSGTAPPEVAALFAARALGTGLAAWAALGALAGHFWTGGRAEG